MSSNEFEITLQRAPGLDDAEARRRIAQAFDLLLGPAPAGFELGQGDPVRDRAAGELQAVAREAAGGENG